MSVSGITVIQFCTSENASVSESQSLSNSVSVRKCVSFQEKCSLYLFRIGVERVTVSECNQCRKLRILQRICVVSESQCIFEARISVRGNCVSFQNAIGVVFSESASRKYILYQNARNQLSNSSASEKVHQLCECGRYATQNLPSESCICTSECCNRYLQSRRR